MAACPGGHRAPGLEACWRSRCSSQAHSGDCRHLCQLPDMGQAATGLCGQCGVGRFIQSAG
eukprot:8854747-Alexandrium_andersonii.AAC.1